MKDINPIYHNNFGFAFQWKRNCVKDIQKVQLIFKDTGLLLTKEELLQFAKNIKHTKDTTTLCRDCPQNESCKALLVNSPAPQITFAMSLKELDAVMDLVEGTLFQMNLDNYLGDLCRDNQ